MRKSVLILGLAVAVFAGGCASTKRTDAPSEAEIDALNSGLKTIHNRSRVGVSSSYVIDPPDVIAVYVKDNDDLSAESVTVGPDGKISLRLLDGAVTVAGRTVDEVAADLRRRYAKYIRDASVTVMVTAYKSKWFYVHGEVKRPGRYPYTGNDSVVNALAQAGFLTRRASPNGIHVAKGNPNDPELYPVRLKDITIDDDSRTNWYLDPEDIVHVPPTFLSKVGFAIEEILFPFTFLVGPATGYSTYQDTSD